MNVITEIDMYITCEHFTDTLASTCREEKTKEACMGWVWGQYYG